jgi:hypothetical protein
MKDLKVYEDSELVKLEQLANDYRNLVVTRDNLKDADRARITLKNARLDIQKIQKANAQVLKDLVAQNKEKGEKFISITEPIEIRIGKDIDMIEAEIEMEKRAEENRKKQCLAYIQVLKDKISMVATSNRVDFIEDCMNITAPEDIAEFLGEFNEANADLKTVCSERLEFVKMKEAKEKQERMDAEYIKQFEHLTFVFSVETDSVYIDNKHQEKSGLHVISAKDAFEWCKNMKVELEQLPDLTAPDEVVEHKDEVVSANDNFVQSENGMFEPMLRPIPETFSQPEQKKVMVASLAGQVSTSMGVNTKPAHSIEYLGYWIKVDPKMPQELFERVKAAICDILDSEDIV